MTDGHRWHPDPARPDTVRAYAPGDERGWLVALFAHAEPLRSRDAEEHAELVARVVNAVRARAEREGREPLEVAREIEEGRDEGAEGAEGDGGPERAAPAWP